MLPITLRVSLNSKPTNKMSRILYDWEPVVKDFLRTLTNKGVTILAVNDGDEWVDTQSIQTATEAITSVDESWLKVSIPSSNPEDVKRGTLYFVLGNGPQEIVADYSDNPLIDDAVDDHWGKWVNKEIPTKEV